MINSEQAAVLFPFSVQIAADGTIKRLGRTLERRLPGAIGARIEDVFVIRRWEESTRPELIHRLLDRLVQLRIKGDSLVLSGAFSEVDGGLVFLGAPRVSQIEELEALELKLDDFALHDGAMTYLFLLQQMRAATDEASESAAELAVRAKSYRQIVEQSNDLIMRIGVAGVVTFANPEACHLLPVVPGSTQFEALLTDGQDVAWAECRAMLDREVESVWVELSFRGRDRDAVLVEGPLVRSQTDDEQKVMLGFFRDVSERKRAQRDLVKSTEQLRRAQKMEAIGRFAGGIAHDFNNLLGVVMGAGGMLKEDLPEGDPRARDVDLILASAEKGSALARQLLMFGGRQPSSGEGTELVSCTRNLMQILHRVLGKRIQLDFHSDCDAVAVSIDRGHLEQILMNLVVNARDAIPDGGCVQLNIRELPGAEAALVEVRDDGEGMSEDVMQKAFEPFFTTKPSDQGTGLGLSVVYGIVTDAGGDIDVASAPGAGTTFSIRLPVAAESAAVVDSPSGAPRARSGVGANMLAVILEDQDDLRRLTARGLETMGFDVRPFSSIAECRAGCRDLDSRLDLLVTDVGLADGDGLDLAEELAAERTVSRGIVITGHANLERIDELIARFGWRLLMKPFTMRELQLVVGQVTQQP